ncbi:ankyrin repeat domain-containing protein 50-like [Haliotis asinina]|uniref:ankyrin repeat domain-containing protein 50-like n=1 Tax=Haliotis asinina TaxID=109174 RepID=UPI0035320F06
MTIVYLSFVVFVPGVFCVIPCAPGFYGELCDKHCNVNCRSHVDNQTHCDKDTGACLSGCLPGRWGSQCDFTCSKNCVDRVCVYQTGQCAKGCTENYIGDLCEVYIVPHLETLTETPTKGPTEGTQSHKPDTTAPVITFTVTTFTVTITVFCIVMVAIRAYIRYRRQLDYAGKWRTDLHDASYWGDVSRVKRILSEGQADINCVDVYGRTPIMWAARQNQKNVFDILVSSGASLSLTDKSGNNMLHSACHGGHKDIVQNILSKGSVDINSKDRYGRTAVMMAESKGYKDLVELLVGNGDDPSLHGDIGNTVLLGASSRK